MDALLSVFYPSPQGLGGYYPDLTREPAGGHAGARAATPADTGNAFSETLTPTTSKPRALSDTGVTQTDSLARSRGPGRTAADTGITSSESIAYAITRGRALSDTGITSGESLAANSSSAAPRHGGQRWLLELDHYYGYLDRLTVFWPRLVSAPGQGAGSSIARTPSDTGLSSSSESIAVALGKRLTDTGIAFSETVRISANARQLSDNGLTQSWDAGTWDEGTWDSSPQVDSVFRGGAVPRAISDVGLIASTDVVGRSVIERRTPTDTGVTQSDFIGSPSGPIRTITDTGSAFAEALDVTSTGAGTGRSRPITDRGVSFSESLGQHATYPRTGNDTGVFVGDLLARVTTAGRALATTGVTHSDSIARTAGHDPVPQRVAVDNGISPGDQIAVLVGLGPGHPGLIPAPPGSGFLLVPQPPASF